MWSANSCQTLQILCQRKQLLLQLLSKVISQVPKLTSCSPLQISHVKIRFCLSMQLHCVVNMFLILLSYIWLTHLLLCTRCNLPAVCSPGTSKKTSTKLKRDPLVQTVVFLTPSLPVSLRSNMIYLPKMTSSLQLLQTFKIKKCKTILLS